MSAVTRTEVPVYFFTGRHDYTTPFALIEEYYAQLEAPHKALIWFNTSAHFPFFEEPQRFAQEMAYVLAETQEGVTARRVPTSGRNMDAAIR